MSETSLPQHKNGTAFPTTDKPTVQMEQQVPPSAVPGAQTGTSTPNIANLLGDTPQNPFKYPNRWARIRRHIREPAAEFLGTMTFMVFGLGSQCQVYLSRNPGVAISPAGDYLSVALSFAVGLALGGWVAGGITGGHINPSVTIAQAVVRKLPWRKVPIYILAQVLGAYFGALLVYANYIHAIDIWEGGRHIRSVPGSASLFATYPPVWMTNVSCFFSEFLGTAFLIIAILAATDYKNSPPPKGITPLVFFFVLLGESSALGLETGFAINPARDFGPRLATYTVGYGKEVWNFRHQYWIWTPILGPLTGGLVGAFLYDTLLFTEEESIVNRPSSSAIEKRQEIKRQQQRMRYWPRSNRSSNARMAPPENMV